MIDKPILNFFLLFLLQSSEKNKKNIFYFFIISIDIKNFLFAVFDQMKTNKKSFASLRPLPGQSSPPFPAFFIKNAETSALREKMSAFPRPPGHQHSGCLHVRKAVWTASPGRSSAKRVSAKRVSMSWRWGCVLPFFDKKRRPPGQSPGGVLRLDKVLADALDYVKAMRSKKVV